jgi:hypothetical protein
LHESDCFFRIGKYRFFFFSREELKKHVHVISPEGEAKFWIEPEVILANQMGLTGRQIILILGRFATAKMLRMSYTERNSLI